MNKEKRRTTISIYKKKLGPGTLFTWLKFAMLRGDMYSKQFDASTEFKKLIRRTLDDKGLTSSKKLKKIEEEFLNYCQSTLEIFRNTKSY